MRSEPGPDPVLTAGPTRAVISLHGGAILSLDWQGVPLLRPALPGAAPIDSGCYPLVPFGNRVRGNRFSFGGTDYRLAPNTGWDPHYLHGEGWRSDWQVAELAGDRIAMTHRHDGSALPYRYAAEQSIRLNGSGAELSLSVTNEGDVSMPFGIGWHPYFPMTPRTRLQTRTGRMWSEEPGWLPGAPGPVPADLDFRDPAPLPGHWVNNGFEDWSGRARIIWPERGTALTVAADPLFRTMFLFVGDTDFDPGYRRDFFALEPMSHLADGHNQPGLGGLSVLEPGAVLSGSVRLIAEVLA